MTRERALEELRRLAATLQECGPEAACERLLERVAAAEPEVRGGVARGGRASGTPRRARGHPMKRDAEQLDLALEAPAAESVTAAARELEAPPEGVEFVTDEELDLIFGPRPEARADVCTGEKGAKP